MYKWTSIKCGHEQIVGYRYFCRCVLFQKGTSHTSNSAVAPAVASVVLTFTHLSPRGVVVRWHGRAPEVHEAYSLPARTAAGLPSGVAVWPTSSVLLRPASGLMRPRTVSAARRSMTIAAIAHTVSRATCGCLRVTRKRGRPRLHRAWPSAWRVHAATTSR